MPPEEEIMICNKRNNKGLAIFVKSNLKLDAYIKSKEEELLNLIKLIKQRPSPLEKVEVAQDMRNINYIVEVINDIVNNWDLYTSIDELKRKD
jgi:hypothetical protein